MNTWNFLKFHFRSCRSTTCKGSSLQMSLASLVILMITIFVLKHNWLALLCKHFNIIAIQFWICFIPIWEEQLLSDRKLDTARGSIKEYAFSDFSHYFPVISEHVNTFLSLLIVFSLLYLLFVHYLNKIRLINGLIRIAIITAFYFHRLIISLSKMARIENSIISYSNRILYK